MATPKSSVYLIKVVMFVSLFFTLMFLIAGMAMAAVAPEKGITASREETFGFQASSACDTFSYGKVSVEHRVNPNSDETISVGSSFAFSYDPADPFFNLTAGPWDTPYGRFCSGIDDQCFGNIKSPNKGSSVLSVRTIDNFGYEYWTAVKPVVSIVSSKPGVISCAGMTCTANAPGTATLTANIGATPARIWVFADVSTLGGSLWLSGFNKDIKHYAFLVPDLAPGGNAICKPKYKGARLAAKGANAMDLPAQTLSWDFTVVSAIVPFDYILLNDGNITVKQGEKGETKITATHIFGSAKDVSFSVSGLPPLSSTPGIPTCKPTCARDLEIFTSPGTPVGTYPITVTGSPLGKTTTFNLIVSSGLVILPSSIDLKVNGKDHQTLADALVKKSGKKVNFDWKGTSVKNCRTWEGDPDWPHPFVPPNGDAHGYTLPIVSTLTTYEYRISCDSLAQKGLWNRFLALFRFVKNVFAQAGDANDSVFIIVEPPPGPGVNSPPSADAGSSHSITSGTPHTHSGASASDPDGNLASYLWEFDSCPGGSCPVLSGSSGLISGGSAAVPGPTFTPVSLGAYHLKLTVTDTNDAKGDDKVTETVTASPSDPVASLTASPPLILKGESSDLIWSCDKSTTAEINNGVMAPIACSGGSCSGTKEVSPTVNTNYTLTCTKTPPGVTATASVTVQVGKIIED